MFTLKHNLVAAVLAASIPTLMAVALADEPVKDQPAPDFQPGEQDILPVDVVLFGFDSTAIDRADLLQVADAARWLQSHPDQNLVVEAHTDASGSRLYNVDLAERRADRIRDILMAVGVAGDRVTKVICGEGRSLGVSPAADRRVVLFATELDFDELVRATPEPCYPVVI